VNLQTERRNGDVFVIKLTTDESIFFGNTLNEVLRGIRVDNFEHRIKASKESTQQLWSKFTRNAPLSNEVTLSSSEITSLCSSARLCYEEFGSEEFSTRLGFSAAEAFKRVEALENLLR
jgi:hypothetical protein